VSVDESAKTLIPLMDIVANVLVAVTLVIYPASLFNCEMLLPETTTFFHSAMFFPYFIYKYYAILKNYSNPTKKEADVKYMPPFGAGVVNSAL
jgi:hypothetical protein